MIIVVLVYSSAYLSSLLIYAVNYWVFDLQR